MDNEVARTKVIPALRRADTLARPRLLDWLTIHTRRRLSLIVAEAGYGKTTLLADFSSRSRVTCLWFTVDEHEGDWVTFANYVIGAIREARPDFGAATRPLLAQMLTTDPPRSLVIDTLISEVAAIDDLRAIFIVDDFHLVDQTPDALEIMDRLIKEAPPGMTFVVATRRMPDLKRGRLAAQGEAATLTADDLRFSRDETEQLFREVYGQALEAEVVEQIDRRTEGWAASLQLLGSSIRSRSAVEARELVRSLSGAEEPLYDFLAEEVLSDLRPELRRFVITASLLERITSAYVVALFETDDPAPDEATAAAWIDEVDRMGLAGRHAAGSPHRFHPLLRDFLLRQLGQLLSPSEVRDRHRRVARRAEQDAWLISCHHYLEAGDSDDAIRVLTRSLLVAAGTGDWGPASNLLARLPQEPADPAAQIILALQEIHELRLADALDRLQAIPLPGLDPTVRGMVRYARLRAAWHAGDVGESMATIHELTSEQDTPDLLRDLAEAHRSTFAPGGRQELGPLSRRLQTLAESHLKLGLHFFAGVSLHNLMLTSFLGANYAQASSYGYRALQQFAKAAAGVREIGETQAFLANVLLEANRLAEAEDMLAQASEAVDDVGALANIATARLSMGRIREAEEALGRLELLSSRLPRNAGHASDVLLLQARLHIACAQPSRAMQALRSPASPAVGPGMGVAYLTVQAMAAACANDSDTASITDEALRAALEDGATHWERRARLISAATFGSASALRSALQDAAQGGTLAISDVAEVLISSLDRLDDTAPEIESSIARWPDRWLPLLRRRLESGLDQGSLRAARLLAEFGCAGDVPLLRAWERRHIRRSAALHLGRQLALRTSPKLLVHDLGAARIERGDRQVGLATVRRRSAMLFLYLVAKPGHAALREQLLEDIWPDLDPAAAANSLNQTLYFIRRDIEPGYDEAVSVNYIVHDGDLLRLEPELVEVDSWRFQKQATSRELRSAGVDDSLAVLATYEGPFAPVFAYEDWAIDWREQLHTSYLDLVARTQHRLLAESRIGDAVSLTQQALAIDAKAIEIERSLVWLYRAAGSHSAAAEQYRHYAIAHREELGIEPPSFEALISQGIQPQD